MLILMPWSASALQAFTPAFVVGSFTTTCLCQSAYSSPSLHIAAASVATTSTDTGPPTTSHISRMVSLLFGLPSFAISDGLVVTPSRIPMAAASRISCRLAVSMKNFMRSVQLSAFVLDWISQRADPRDGDFDHVAGAQRSDAGWGARGDQVAGLQRHHAADEADYSIERKDEILGRAALPRLAIHPRLDRHVRRVDLVGQ